MDVDAIPLKIERGETAFYGTSDALPGLLVMGNTEAEVREKAPEAIRQLLAVKAEVEGEK